MPQNRDKAGRFIKGQSGNAGGRPKQSDDFKAVVQRHSLPALMTVIGIMENPDANAADRLKAANIVIERAYGKAPQAVDLTTVTVSADTQEVIDRLLRENREQVP